MEYNELFARTELLVGRQAMQSLSAKKVILFGVGGVGSWCAEGLIRSGIMHLTMVDSDRVAIANSNRQLPATTQTIGELKVEVLKKRLQEINPFATITAIPEIYSAESSASFQLEQYDYVIDAIDSLSHKAHLLLAASASGATIFSSMGAALKMDPQQIRVADFWKVRGCKLASALRGRIRKGVEPQVGDPQAKEIHANGTQGIESQGTMLQGAKLQKPILCVYSEERLSNIGQEALADADEKGSFRKAQTNGTMVQVTAVFGFTLSGLVIQDIVKKMKFNNSKEEIHFHR